MSLIKITDLERVIPICIFDKCLIDNLDRPSICKLYSSTICGGRYFIDKFIYHLKLTHNQSIKEYLKFFFQFDWPKCPISNKDVGYKINGKGLKLSTFKRGSMSKKHCPAFAEACIKMSKRRMGEGNPMFGKTAWNLNLGLNDPYIVHMSNLRKGAKSSIETKEKIKRARLESPIKARHTIPHAEDSKQKMRDATIARWLRGDFSNKKTNIELIVENYLKDEKMPFEFQFSVENTFIADFGCKEKKVIIECQGDWFHCNPKINKYKNPKYDVQKRNVQRDIAKRLFYKTHGWELIELWESDINSGEFKKILKCKLEKLFL